MISPKEILARYEKYCLVCCSTQASALIYWKYAKIILNAWQTIDPAMSQEGLNRLVQSDPRFKNRQFRKFYRRFARWAEAESIIDTNPLPEFRSKSQILADDLPSLEEVESVAAGGAPGLVRTYLIGFLMGEGTLTAAEVGAMRVSTDLKLLRPDLSTYQFLLPQTPLLWQAWVGYLDAFSTQEQTRRRLNLSDRWTLSVYAFPGKKPGQGIARHSVYHHLDAFARRRDTVQSNLVLV